MSLISLFRGLQVAKSLTVPVSCTVQKCNYAVGKLVKKTGKKQKITLSVETDPDKLLTYCCGANIYKDGEEIKLKPDSEYPDWLWDIRLRPKKIEEMDPNTKEYWRALRRQMLIQNNRRAKLSKFKK